MITKNQYKLQLTLANSDATPRPVVGFTANADVIHSVIVSGALVLIIVLPLDLK